MNVSDAISGFGFFNSVQAIPAPASLVFNAALLFVVWRNLYKHRNKESSIRIINHTALLLLAWITFSAFAGLLMTFDLLETAKGPNPVDGFLYGLRIALAIMAVGILILCTPVILYLRAGRIR